MKKSFLFLLISIMTVFLIAGCAEDTTEENGDSTTPPTVVPIDPKDTAKLMGLFGDYEIVFFYTNGGGFLSIASDCSKVEYYTGKADAKCVQGTNNVDFKGYGKVYPDDSNKPTSINITSKMQMTNDGLKNGSNAFWIAAQNNQYNYNVFTPIPVTAITNGAINDGPTAVKGVNGRHLTQNVTTPGSTYKFELLSDGSVRNTMLDKSNAMAEANVTVIMKKIEKLPNGYTMEKDTQFPQPKIEGFVDNPAEVTP